MSQVGGRLGVRAAAHLSILGGELKARRRMKEEEDAGEWCGVVKLREVRLWARSRGSVGAGCGLAVAWQILTEAGITPDYGVFHFVYIRAKLNKKVEGSKQRIW